jgi:hypothetical protein
MPLPQPLRQQVEATMTKYCATRVPADLRDEIRVGFDIRGHSVTLFEERRHWKEKTRWVHRPVAQFRLDVLSLRWTIYCADRNSKWHRFPDPPPATFIDILLKEVDRDTTGIFWG